MQNPTARSRGRRATRSLREWGIPIASPRRVSRRQRSAAPGPDRRPVGASGAGPRVLVVEDDPDTRRVLLLGLADELGEPVAPAADGEEALWVAAEAPPDVVVLDIGLPKRDGYEVIRQLRADPRTANAWVIALTGTGTPREAARAGFDQFLWKPVDLGHVALAVQAGLSRRTPDVPPSMREIELLAQRLGPLAEELVDASEDQLADVFERIERQLRD